MKLLNAKEHRTTQFELPMVILVVLDCLYYQHARLHGQINQPHEPRYAFNALL